MAKQEPISLMKPDSSRGVIQSIAHSTALSAALVFASMLSSPVAAGPNGFTIEEPLVPKQDILKGGPPRDGIPAIIRPGFTSAKEATQIDPRDRVLGYSAEGIARAYPIAILNWHEVVNDRVGERGLLVTYCPLCGTGMAFTVGPTDLFGVSGLLYNSDVLLYDRATESLWSQIMGKAISGPRKAEALVQVPLQHTTWDNWLTRHPDTLVLLPPSGSRTDYSRDPYAGYEKSRDLYFKVSARNGRYHPKEKVLGVTLSGNAKAYPFSELEKAGNRVEETFGEFEIIVHHDLGADSAWAEVRRAGADGAYTEVASVIGYWFAWYAFHPDTEVFRFEADTRSR